MLDNLLYIRIIRDIHKGFAAGDDPSFFFQVWQIAQCLHRFERDDDICPTLWDKIRIDRFAGEAKVGLYIAASLAHAVHFGLLEIEEVIAHVKAIKNHVLLDVETLAKEAGAPLQAANMVLLGAAIPMLGIDHDKIVEGVKRIFARKGETVVAANIAAIEAGYRASKH